MATIHSQAWRRERTPFGRLSPAAYADGLDYAGSVGGTANTGPTSDDITGVTIAAGQSASNYNFTEKGGVISGNVFLDLNQDSQLDSTAGDKVLSGVQVDLVSSTTGQTISTTTDSNGNYSFSGLAADNYTVLEYQPTAYGDGKDYSDAATGGTPVASPVPDANFNHGFSGITLGARAPGRRWRPSAPEASRT